MLKFALLLYWANIECGEGGKCDILFITSHSTCHCTLYYFGSELKTNIFPFKIKISFAKLKEYHCSYRRRPILMITANTFNTPGKSRNTPDLRSSQIIITN